MNEIATTNGADKPLSLLERRRLEVEAKRLVNKAKAEEVPEASVLARLDDEEAFEEARAKAYSDPAIGPDRCIWGRIEGAGDIGFALFKWPDDANWRHFQNKGILKKDGLSTELADDLTCRCLLYPSLEKWREIMRRNPAASFTVAAEITAAMAPTEAESGKGLRSSRQRR